ncbi:MAG: GNAT family N-acetyltransferase, partial [Acidimicrobiales bacterium]
VADHTANHRFLLTCDGDEAELVYRRRGDRLLLVHAGVPEALGGRGLAAQLVQKAMEDARENSLTVVPLCPYVRSWLEKHPDEAATVKIEWPSESEL